MIWLITTYKHTNIYIARPRVFARGDSIVGKVYAHMVHTVSIGLCSA